MTEADLDSIERALGFPLPAFYRRFMVNYVSRPPGKRLPRGVARADRFDCDNLGKTPSNPSNFAYTASGRRKR
jgi:hypothetical protein